ncbi:hypothetical protein [Pseudophaeobacter sp.]|uniref:hypothetical protein n=1 Tax=Pseudophaeobacter sp. TaxID=1971739 RepID=UPI0032996C3A
MVDASHTLVEFGDPAAPRLVVWLKFEHRRAIGKIHLYQAAVRTESGLAAKKIIKAVFLGFSRHRAGACLC